MAIGTIPLFPGTYQPPDGTTNNLPAQWIKTKTTAAAPTGYFGQLNFDAANKEQAHFQEYWPEDYSTGLTAVVLYKTASGVSGGVAFDVRIGAVTPDVDTIDVDTKGYSTANVGTDTVPAVAGRLAKVSFAVSAADSVAAGDLALILLCRDPAHASDTVAGDVEVVEFALTYTATP